MCYINLAVLCRPGLLTKKLIHVILLPLVDYGCFVNCNVYMHYLSPVRSVHSSNTVATSSCVTSKMNGLTETINPTTMQSNSHIMMTSPSVTPQSTPNAVYAQVRFLNVVNCASFTVCVTPKH